MGVGGVLALIVLGRAAWRAGPGLLLAGSLLAGGGIVLNRVILVRGR